MSLATSLMKVLKACTDRKPPGKAAWRRMAG